MHGGARSTNRIALLDELTQKTLWLSNWMIHHANHLRPNLDGVKVGGHQASSASLATIMTALYFDVLRPEDRVAVKPHASPVFHAIQYLFGHQTRDKLENFRGYKGAQSYPSRLITVVVPFPATALPGAKPPMARASSRASLTVSPLTAVITSPDSIPALAAGPSFWGSATNAPFACFKPMLSAISCVTG